MALEVSERCLLLVGGVACLMLLFSPCWDLFQFKRLLQIQEQRKAQLEEACGDLRGTDELSYTDLKNFIVDDKHGIIYCYIPKVACTNWKRVMYVLNQSEPYADTLSVDKDAVHEVNMFTLLSSFPRAELKARLKHYTKFLFVRDPFVRLISAYKDKFYRHNEYFYQSFGKNILKKYAHMPNPPDTEDEAFQFGIRPTFKHFVQYLVDPQTEENEPFEPHWRQMHRLCHPCTIQYDFIGHQETLQEDANLLLKMLMLDNIRFPPSPSPTKTDSLWDWFKVVPLEDRRRLYRLYEQDYNLFGYPKPQSLLSGQEDEEGDN